MRLKWHDVNLYQERRVNKFHTLALNKFRQISRNASEPYLLNMTNLLKELPESCKADFQTFDEIFGAEGLKPKRWKGYGFIPGMEPETIEYAMKNHEPKENEVLIVSYSKTGTTWAKEIVRQILYGRDEKLDLITQDITPALNYLETGNYKKYNILDNLPIPRNYYATHLPAELTNTEKYKSRNMKFIYTLRNPKDRLVSLFHFFPKFPWYTELTSHDPKDWDAFFQVHLHGQFPICMKIGEDYIEHILGWLPHIKDNENAMIMVYENMIKHPQREVKQMADFLGVKLSEEEILTICEKTSFAEMKKPREVLESGWMQAMTRKGQIGQWKDYFTPEQSAMIDELVEKKLKGTGITFVYE